MSVIYRINKEHDGVEIKFSEKPSKKVLAMLKEFGFRWHPTKGIWYAKNTAENRAFAERIKDDKDYKQMSLFEDEEVAEEVVEAESKEVEEVAEVKAFTRNRSKQSSTGKSRKNRVNTTTAKKSDANEDANETPSNIFQFSFDFSEHKSYSLDDCKAKMDKERKKFVEPDHQYVINGLLKMAEADKEFCNRIMDADKSYKKAFDFVTEEARKMAKNGCIVFSADKALEIALNYYRA